MRKRKLLILLTLLFAVNGLHAKKVTIMTIGNSFAVNALKFLEEIVQNGGHKLDVVEANIGGASLKTHWENFQAYKSDPYSEKAMSYDYGRKNIEQILKMKDYDYITIQQLSSSSFRYGTFMPYASDMYDIIKKFAPDAEVVIHQTWAYREDDKLFGRIKKGYTQKQMFKDLEANYKRLSEELGFLKIIPVGKAFQAARNSGKWNFTPDKSFDFANAKPPALPDDKHSLNVGWKWSSKGRLFNDGHHANENGEYLAGLIWYAFFFDADPREITYVPSEVSKEDAAILREVAGEVADTIDEMNADIEKAKVLSESAPSGFGGGSSGGRYGGGGYGGGRYGGGGMDSGYYTNF